MDTIARAYDVITMGRSSIDLYSNDVGAPFVEITSFAAYVGGSPTNICVGANRLGIKSTLLTAVGVDPVGDFILNFLNKEGINTRYIPRKPGHRTSAVVLGIYGVVLVSSWMLAFIFLGIWLSYRPRAAHSALPVAAVDSVALTPARRA